jgi:hypothetical protein
MAEAEAEREQRFGREAYSESFFGNRRIDEFDEYCDGDTYLLLK